MAMNAPVIGSRGLAGLGVEKLGNAQGTVLAGLEALDGVRRQQLDVRLLARPLEHDLRGAELLAAVHHGDLGGKLRQEDSLLHRRVPAADDHGLGVLKKAASQVAQ